MGHPDKEQIITIVNTWLERSHLSIAQVVARMQVQGCLIERTSFENRFTTRVDQKPDIAPEWIMALVTAFSERLSETARCRADEALRLAALVRLPINQLQALERLFPTAEFSAAYRPYAPLVIPLPPSSGHSAVVAPPPPLPLAATSFIGRTRETQQLKRLITRVRLLTLTGPGGCGKTRLAVQVATDLRSATVGSVFFVPLAPINDPNLVTAAIAQTLHVGEVTGVALLDSLTAYLRERRVLLILDNFEHVLAAAPLVAQLLSAAPQLHILVTSRAALQLSFEQEFAVPPLPYPDLAALPPLANLADCPSVALFVARARAVRPHFALNSANAAAVAQICACLDGLPLAIELAAARIRLSAPQTLLHLLGNRLTLLTGGPKDAPARHQTLRATIDWSYDLLDAREKTFFVQLAVFTGGSSLEAIVAICDHASAQPLAGRQHSATHPQMVLDSLTSLLAKNLLRQVEGPEGEPRFMLLETIGEYAQERLKAQGDTLVRQRHADYYVELAQKMQLSLHGTQQGAGMRRLAYEHDNIRTALAWLLTCAASEQAARLCATLELFWYWNGYLSEGRRWLAAVLANGGTLSQAARAKVLDVAGGLAWAQGDFTQAKAFSNPSLALWRELDDPQGVVEAINTLGLVAESEGNYADAVTWYEAGLALRRQLGDSAAIALALSNLGDALLYMGSYLYANQLLEEGYTRYTQLGDQRGAADALVSLGDAALLQGFPAQATPLFEQSLQLFRQIQTVNRRRVAHCLERLAGALTVLHQPQRGAQLLGTAAALRETIGAPIPPASQPYYAQTLSDIQAQLDSEEFARAWAQGYTRNFDQVIG